MATEPEDVSLADYLDDARKYLAPPGETRQSIRGLADQIGVPYSTLRDQIRGNVRNPRQETTDAIERGLAGLGPRITRRDATWSIDAAAFTDDLLGNINQIPGTVDVKFIFRTADTPSGRATSEAVAWLPGGLPAMVRASGLRAANVTRVVLRMARGR